MKTNFLLRKMPWVAAVILMAAVVAPEPASAKPDKKEGKSQGSSKNKKRGNPNSNSRDRNDYSRSRDGDRNYNRDRERIRYYNSRPRSSFTLNFGTGYAGRGYYYGPPNTSYYYQRPEVRYYATRELAPREYYQPSYRQVSVGASVQRALARRGYYRGGIDGSLGPYSRRAIARYQADHGLAPTGSVTPGLLRSLGL